jgi:hypothetical protein
METSGSLGSSLKIKLPLPGGAIRSTPKGSISEDLRANRRYCVHRNQSSVVTGTFVFPGGTGARFSWVLSQCNEEFLVGPKYYF